MDNSDKNKLFTYPESELEGQESISNPTSGTGDVQGGDVISRWLPMLSLVLTAISIYIIN